MLCEKFKIYFGKSLAEKGLKQCDAMSRRKKRQFRSPNKNTFEKKVDVTKNKKFNNENIV